MVCGWVTGNKVITNVGPSIYLPFSTCMQILFCFAVALKMLFRRLTHLAGQHWYLSLEKVVQIFWTFSAEIKRLSFRLSIPFIMAVVISASTCKGIHYNM